MKTVSTNHKKTMRFHKQSLLKNEIHAALIMNFLYFFCISHVFVGISEGTVEHSKQRVISDKACQIHYEARKKQSIASERRCVSLPSPGFILGSRFFSISIDLFFPLFFFLFRYHSLFLVLYSIFLART